MQVAAHVLSSSNAGSSRGRGNVRRIWRRWKVYGLHPERVGLAQPAQAGAFRGWVPVGRDRCWDLQSFFCWAPVLDCNPLFIGQLLRSPPAALVPVPFRNGAACCLHSCLEPDTTSRAASKTGAYSAGTNMGIHEICSAHLSGSCPRTCAACRCDVKKVPCPAVGPANRRGMRHQERIVTHANFLKLWYIRLPLDVKLRLRL